MSESDSDPFATRLNVFYESNGEVLDRLKSAKDFDDRDLRTHIYLTPDTYAGSDKWASRPEWVLDMADGNPQNFRIKMVPITTPYVIVQAFVEVISNSADNITDCRQIGIAEHPVGKCAIEVYMDRQDITVKNYGQPIPVEIKEYEDKESHITYQKWVPEYVLTKLLVSSNYDGSKTRHGAGKNGVGAKLMVIFSKRVVIEVVDGYRGRKYTQLVENNMTLVHPPIVEVIEIGTESSTTITYRLDFERFGITEYNDEAFAIISNRTLGTSFTMKSPTSFNGVEFRYYHIKEYGRLIFGKLVDTAIVRYELENPETEEVRMKKIGEESILTPVVKAGQPKRVVIPDTEVLLIDSAYAFHDTVVSFVNSVPTIKGGAHVKKLYDVVIPPILQKINQVEPKVNLTKLKGKQLRIAAAKRSKQKENAKAREAPKRALRKDDVRPYISGIINCRVHDPSFNSQTKVELAGPEPKLTLDKQEIQTIYTWHLMEKLHTHLQAMKMYMLEKLNGRKVKNIRMKNGVDAYYAGTKRSDECMLWIVEGTSALAYAMSLLALIPKGRDTIGVMAIRGKFVNVLKADPEKLLVKKELKLLMQILGLQFGTKYDDPVNYDKLRYGKGVMIMADADKDGSHIKGLLANFFYGMFPELLRIGYVSDYRTKFLKATNRRSKETVRFYTEWQFTEWKQQTPGWNRDAWKYDYFKGLGTAEDADVNEDFKSMKTIQFTYVPEEDAIMFDTIFGKSNSDKRKEWMSHIRGYHSLEYHLTPKVQFSTFFNREFIGYVIESLDRAIPNASDGLKRCHRQILHAMTKHWAGKGPYTDKKYKVAQFAGYVATQCEYQHNEHCIALATIIMARNFVGSNNIQLLVDRGRFGSRFFGGDDHASPRYIYTNPSELMYKIFRKEDMSILERHKDDGKDVEPKAYYPIFPLILANGAQGVATGYSTTVMNYNPIEVVDWLMISLYNRYFASADDKLPLHILIPWFKGFKGKVMLIRNGAGDELNDPIRDPIIEGEETQTTLDDLTEEGDVVIPPDIGHERTISTFEPQENEYKFDRVVIQGEYSITPTGDVHVSELPVGKWTINYNYFLQDLRDFKQIKDFKDSSNMDVVDITIEGMRNPSYKKLGLIKRVSLSNMVFLDENKVPVRFRLVEDYLEYFMELRMKMYEKRIAHHLVVLDEKLRVAQVKERFITSIRDGKVRTGGSAEEIEEDLTRLGLPTDLLDTMTIRRLSKEKTETMKREIHDIEAEIELFRVCHPARLWYSELSELRNELIKDPSMIRGTPGLLLTKEGAKKYYPIPKPKE